MPFLAVITIYCFTSSANAQVRMTNDERSKDSIEVEAVSIADLEMIVPENRLKPEVKLEEEPATVESPFSSTQPKRIASTPATLTAKDLEMLESVTPSEQASEGASR